MAAYCPAAQPHIEQLEREIKALIWQPAACDKIREIVQKFVAIRPLTEELEALLLALPDDLRELCPSFDQELRSIINNALSPSD